MYVHVSDEGGLGRSRGRTATMIARFTDKVGHDSDEGGEEEGTRRNDDCTMYGHVSDEGGEEEGMRRDNDCAMHELCRKE